MIKRIILLIEGIALCLYNHYHFAIPCFFKMFFHIPCPGCGMTRAFREIIHLHILKSFSYNILGLPFFLFIFIIQILLIYDVIYKKNELLDFLRKITKYIYVILLFVMISWVVNIFSGI